MAKLIDITGKALSGEWGTDDESGDGIPVLRTTNFTNEGVVNYNDVVTRTITKKNIEEKFLRKGDIIIEKSGGSDKFPVGRVIYFDGDENTYLFNNFTGLLRVKDQDAWYPRYVFYSLFANYKRGGTRAFENKTTGLHNLKTDDYISRYDVAETDKAQQISICDKLDKLYGIIKSREKELQLLDNLIKARFVELFGDPVHSDKYSTRKLLSCVADKSDMVDGPFGSQVNTKVDYIEDGEIPVIRTVNVKMMSFSPADLKYMTREKYETVKRSQVLPGDVILTKVGTIGNVCIFPDSFEEAVLSTTGSCRIRVDNSIVNTVFFAYNLMYLKGKLLEIASAGVQPFLNMNHVKNIDILDVPLNKQIEFSDFVKQVDKSKVVYPLTVF